MGGSIDRHPFVSRVGAESVRLENVFKRSYADILKKKTKKYSPKTPVDWETFETRKLRRFVRNSDALVVERRETSVCFGQPKWKIIDITQSICELMVFLEMQNDVYSITQNFKKKTKNKMDYTMPTSRTNIRVYGHNTVYILG